ncbi:MAG: type II secretion system GspH family protein [Sulfurimonas sp.]|nr:type II secretion system GspH family protein [Sulfurimonas sp.]
MVKFALNRLAFTLIELLFAIMIMGITMVSVPIIMSSNAKGFETTIIQEAIFAASAELNQALSFRWDENSLNEVTNPTGLTRVIETGDCDDVTRLRPGHIRQKYHRRCLDDDNISVSTLGPDSGDLDDIDDIDTNIKDMFLNDSTTATGYKHRYQSTIGITYGAIGNVNASSNNAKLITITVSDDQGETVTVLRSYTLNIGEVDFYERTY